MPPGGFVHVAPFLDAGELRTIEDAHARLIDAGQRMLHAVREARISPAEYYRQGRERLIVVPERDAPDRICRLEYLCGADSAMHDLVRQRLLPVLEAVGGEPYALFKDKCNEKYPGGGGFTPHQDFAAYRGFGPEYHMTAMIALDDGTIENGCLQFAEDYLQFAAEHGDAIRSTHGSYPLLAFNEGGAANGDIRADVAARLAWRPVPVERGDLVLFDSFVPHRSEPNRSTRSRRALFFTFNALREGLWYERYYDAKRANYDDAAFHVSTPTAHASLETTG